MLPDRNGAVVRAMVYFKSRDLAEPIHSEYWLSMSWTIGSAIQRSIKLDVVRVRHFAGGNTLGRASMSRL